MSLRVATVGRAAALVIAAASAACDPAPAGEAPAGSATGASPNASILPGPRADEPAPQTTAEPDEADAGPRGMLLGSAGQLLRGEAPPAALRPDRPLPLDPLGRAEAPGVTLGLQLKWRNVPAPPKAPEVNADGIARAAAATAFTMTVDLSEEGRLRLALEGRGFPLPPRTELRAREDRFGTVLLWPDGDRYRPVAPGALRALLGERRVDVTPLSPGTVQREVKTRPPVIEGLPDGVATREVQVDSSFGHVVLVFGTLVEAGRGAVPLCRLFVELAGIEPASPVCKANEVPLAARLTWKGGGGVDVEVRSFSRRTDLAPADLVVPPPSATYTVDGLPEVPFGVFLTREDLAAFRTKAVSLPRAADAPGEGFFADNHTDQLLYLVLDGVPTVAVPPQDARYLIGTQPGAYVAQWRTFLGERVEPPATVTLPARVAIGTKAEDKPAPSP